MCGRTVIGREVEGEVSKGGVTNKEGDIEVSLDIGLVLLVSNAGGCNAEGEENGI